MTKYDCSTKCGGKHPFNKGKRNFCKDVQKCACACGPLESMGVSLYDGCIQSCNADPHGATGLDYLNQFDPEDLFNRFDGLVVDGFDPRESVQYMELEDAKVREDSKRKDNNKVILYAFGLLGLVALGFILR